MQIIWEFSVADLNGSEYCFVLDSEKEKFRETIEDFISLGKPVGKNWHVPLILKKEEKYKYDFFHIRENEDVFQIPEEEEEDLMEDAICITQLVYNILHPLLEDQVEFLPMESDDGTYYVMNITNIVDCLDREASVCNITSTGLIIDYEELIFNTERLDGVHMFRIPELPYKIFLTDYVKDIIEDFEEVSFTEDELIFDGITYLEEKQI